MRYLLTVLYALSLAAPCWAADDAKRNTLTPKEIAEGWILLFDGETTFGWQIEGDAKIADGTLAFGGEKEATAATMLQLGSFELRFECRLEGNKQAGIGVKYPQGNTVYSLPGNWPRTWVEGIIRVQGNEGKVEITLDKGKSIGDASHRIGPACFFINASAGSKLALRNIKLKPLAMQPLFNGKDLTSWKEFPDRKSKFSVSKDGVLSIKNGPGDLQTTGQWADFVLQLECRTNGDNLNSGVFFRCQPDKYQQGYEAQIQNQHAKAPKNYTIDEYDPQSHQLKEKKKVENWSQDYGTGAIYRRVPARRAVAKDREWFTMTVVAHGRHIATWVNGIQVVDWTDNRPNSDNGRNGFRSEKGPISLQGHDPTTDLSFRNLRIADLSGKN
jgi:hypothetical protein